MADTVKAVLLNEGKTAISGALVGYTKFAPHSFKLGSGAAYVPNPASVSVTGSLVYSGGAALISSRVISPDTVRHVMTVPEGVGPFSFGSIVMYVNGYDGNPLAFIDVSLPFPIEKVVADSDVNNATPFPKPGSRIIITVVVKHIALQEGEVQDLQVNVIIPEYSNLPYYENEISLPAPLLQPWTQFVLDNHTQAGAPVLVTKRSDNTYWGTPFLQNIAHPYFGSLDGGVVGDDYETEQYNWLWGHYYTTPDADYRGIAGGYGYTTLIEFEPEVIGGTSYLTN